MSLVVNTNVMSIFAQRNLSETQNQVAKAIERLSSGLRVVRASDDAAGLAISDTLRAQIRGINQAIRNANDGISLVQIADGAAETITNILSRMRELAVQSASDSVDANSRSYLDNEFLALRSEIDRISKVTEFNGTKLLSGTGNNSIKLQIGFKSSADDSLTLALDDLDLSTLQIGSVNISTSANAQSAIANIESALSQVAAARSKNGYLQNRLEAAIANLAVTSVNYTAAESRIRDADIAFETAQFTKNNVLAQAGVAVLAQANAQPQLALALLR
jgi:flagellin